MPSVERKYHKSSQCLSSAACSIRHGRKLLFSKSNVSICRREIILIWLCIYFFSSSLKLPYFSEYSSHNKGKTHSYNYYNPFLFHFYSLFIDSISIRYFFEFFSSTYTTTRHPTSIILCLSYKKRVL